MFKQWLKNSARMFLYFLAVMIGLFIIIPLLKALYFYLYMIDPIYGNLYILFILMLIISGLLGFVDTMDKNRK